MKNLFLLAAALLITVSMSHAKEMTFKVDDPGGRNVTEFTSIAPIENIVGTTNQVTGQVTFDPQDLSKPVKGKIQVDLKSLTTGIKMRDEHMQGEAYLHSEKFPFAVFQIEGMIQSKDKMIPDGKTVDVKFTGKFTVHGVTKQIEVAGKAGYYKEVPQLAEHGYPGDMFNFDGNFKINLSDFEIKRPQFLIMKLAEEQAVHINFTATTGR